MFSIIKGNSFTMSSSLSNNENIKKQASSNQDILNLPRQINQDILDKRDLHNMDIAITSSIKSPKKSEPKSPKKSILSKRLTTKENSFTCDSNVFRGDSNFYRDINILKEQNADKENSFSSPTKKMSSIRDHLLSPKNQVSINPFIRVKCNLPLFSLGKYAES